MISSQNFIQLLAGSCCFSILGFYLANNIYAKNKFIFFNFVAEMSVFTALAIVYAKQHSISLSLLNKYSSLNWHQDLVSMLILLGIFIKCGIFLFQTPLLEFKKLNFNRMLTGALLLTPLSGIILYTKLSPLINASTFSNQLIIIALIFSTFTALTKILWQDNIKAKMLNFIILFISYSLFRLWRDPQNLIIYIDLIPYILIICWCFMLIHISASYELKISAIHNLYRTSKFIFLTTTISLASLCSIIWNKNQDLTSKCFIAMILIGLAPSLHNIFFNQPQKNHITDNKQSNFLQLQLFFILLISFFALYFSKAWQHKYSYIIFLTFITFVRFFPKCLSSLFSQNKFIQENSWLDSVYYTIITAPIRLLGRILWLTIDFLVIEKNIIGSISTVSLHCYTLLQLLQTSTYKSWLFFTILGLSILLLNLGIYAYE